RRIRANVLRRHQPGIVTKTLELATEMMCPDASFHPDQAGRHVGQPRFYLAPRPPLPQDNGSALIEAYDMERVLPDIDAHYGDRRADLLGHGVLLGFGAPFQLRLLAGQEHGRTIPLADIAAGFAYRDLWNVGCRRGLLCLDVRLLDDGAELLGLG